VKALGIPAPDKKAKQLMNKFIQEQLQQGKTVEEILAQAVPVRGANVWGPWACSGVLKRT
jgi:hypothetical protein